MYHFDSHCVNIPENVSVDILEILNASWSCSLCRTEFRQLATENKRLLAENMDLRDRLGAVENQLETFRENLKTEIMNEIINEVMIEIVNQAMQQCVLTVSLCVATLALDLL